MSYQLTISLGDVVCYDRESLSEYDHFALTGAVVVDGQVTAFACTPVAVNERIKSSLSPRVVFDGFTDSRDVGIVLRGYDIDNNDGWAKHGDQIKEVSSHLADAVSYVPVVGEIAAAVLEHWPKVVDAFVDFDKDDLLLSHATTVTLPEESALDPRRAFHSISVRASRDDITGYSNWDYSVGINFSYSNSDVPSLGHHLELTNKPVRLSAPEDWIGIWDGEKISCVLTASTHGAGLLDVIVEDRRESPHPERVSTGVAISKSWHVDQEVEEVQSPIGRGSVGPVDLTHERTDPGPSYGSIGDVRGSQTVEQNIVRRGLFRDAVVQSPNIIRLDVTPLKKQVVTDGVNTHRDHDGETDWLNLGGDAVLEIYQVLVDGVGGPGRELRYLSHGSSNASLSRHMVDEMLSRRVSIT